MRAIRKCLPSPAMAVACAALVVALGGVSYAATALPKNSVSTAQLKKNAVTRAKLRKNAVTGVKVKDGSLMAADFQAGQLPAGPRGPKGDKGDPGTQGLQGDPGLSEVQLVSDASASDTISPKSLLLKCPDGKRPIAVSGHVEKYVADEGKVALTWSQLWGDSAWVQAEKVAGTNPGNWTLVGTVTCAKVQ